MDNSRCIAVGSWSSGVFTTKLFSNTPPLYETVREVHTSANLAKVSRFDMTVPLNQHQLLNGYNLRKVIGEVLGQFLGVVEQEDKCTVRHPLPNFSFPTDRIAGARKDVAYPRSSLAFPRSSLAFPRSGLAYPRSSLAPPRWDIAPARLNFGHKTAKIDLFQEVPFTGLDWTERDCLQSCGYLRKQKVAGNTYHFCMKTIFEIISEPLHALHQTSCPRVLHSTDRFPDRYGVPGCLRRDSVVCHRTESGRLYQEM